ncbi:MAG: SEL1-like repeat protein [Verrucomicrobiales bacterium]|nr:SEL1-like repeat protein [Verrucomicrobiales bacterium]
MKTLSAVSLAAAVLATSWIPSASAQSIGRIRKSLDKATGGASAASASGAPVAPPPASTAAQTAANEAAANQRNKAAQVGVEDRVVAFLRQRVDDGSADAAFDLGKRYEEGKGVTADPAEARRLYALSAERGNEEAKAWLAANPEPAKEATAGKAAAGGTSATGAPPVPETAGGSAPAKETAPSPTPAPKP